MTGRPNVPRMVAVLVALAILGAGAAGYVVYHQGGGVGDLLADTYTLHADFTNASGVTPGTGQPVLVAGVDVGSVVDAKLTEDGRARLSLEIRRSELPAVRANATAALKPITPLKDMSVELAPGRAPAPVLRDGAEITTAQTSSPADLVDLLNALDADTRTYLTSLISQVERGTRSRGDDLRNLLVTLGPTTADVHRISSALAARRRDLARLVHNVAIVMKAAGDDRQLAQVVSSGGLTLRSIAAQEAPLRAALAKLPRTASQTSQILDDAAAFSGELGPTARRLIDPVRRLPGGLRSLRDLSDTLTPALADEVRPFVRAARPAVRDLGVATPRLTGVVPPMTSALQALNLGLNELAYNPPGADEGGLFWFSWFVHNWMSLFSTGDANGALGRAVITGTCESTAGLGEQAITSFIQAAMGLGGACP